MFIAILFATAFAIAGTAAFFSIYGLAHIYAATFWSVVVMGTTLEVGKLAAVSFLQRYWTSTGLILKTYLIVAVVGLMIITSAGIFGYLSNAYQQDSVGFKDVQTRIELLKQEEQVLSDREQQIDADVARVGENYVRARMRLMDSYKEEKTTISSRRQEIREEMRELSTKQLEVEAHTGPIIYIARAFGEDVDTAIKWMTLLIIFVFDPLAIALTLAANHALMQRQQQGPPIPPPDRAEKFVDEEESTNGSTHSNDPPGSFADIKEFAELSIEEPMPSIDTEEKLDRQIQQTPEPEFKETEKPVRFSRPRPRRFFAGDPSDFVQRMISTRNNNS